MSRRFYLKSSTSENLNKVTRIVPWKIVLLLIVLFVIATPVYLFASRLGSKLLPTATNYFYGVTGPVPLTTPTPLPSLSPLLPQVGSLLYTVQEGDSCDEILSVQMNMSDAGEVFSDLKPETIQALNSALGQDCGKLQPGLVLPLSPQYPLVAVGGIVLKIAAASPQQVIPTPLIKVTRAVESTVDCSDGCMLTVRIAPQTLIRLQVQTTLPVHPGSWIWAQATMARKSVPHFDTYPYADPQASFNNMLLRACDLQVDNTHDDNSLDCDQIMPNTIDDDGGTWLFGVTGSGALNHWRYPLHVPAGTQVLLWLNNDNGVLHFHPGSTVYRYDETARVYVKA